MLKYLSCTHSLQTRLCAHHLAHAQTIFIIPLKVSKTDRESETDKDKSVCGALKLKDVLVFLRVINIIQ